MGAVYEVVENETDERFALKVLAPQLVSDEKHRARFARETTIANAIHSPHVVKVIEAGIDDASETPWLTMELLRGESLMVFIRTHGRLDALHALPILGQIGEAIGAAHRAGVIHRDLKPDNVFVVRDPSAVLEVKVLDFGIAKLASDAGTRTTGAMGSPLWMAPEEAQKAPISAAADVWGFGLLAFFVLTGRQLWRASDEGANVAQALKEVLLEPIPDPVTRAAEWGVTLPRGFGEWFAGCLTRDPSLRFQNADDAWEGLRRILERGSIPEPPPSLDPRSGPVTGSHPSFVPPVPAPSRRSAAPTSGATASWAIGVAGIALATVFLLFAARMIGREMRAADAPVVPSQNGTEMLPSSPTTPIVDFPMTLPLAPVSIDAGDPVVAAVEACFAKDDRACARTALEQSVFAKTATTYHAQLLYDLCDDQHDAQCDEAVARLYPDVNRAAKRARTLSTPGPAASAVVDHSVFTEALPLSVSDPPAARKLLEPRVYAGKATQEEVALLGTICKVSKDADCTRKIAKHYPDVAPKHH
ncbi:hypothetical protein BH09MYX1_BH09MYX1_61870 [soil metagenome]